MMEKLLFDYWDGLNVFASDDANSFEVFNFDTPFIKLSLKYINRTFFPGVSIKSTSQSFD